MANMNREIERTKQTTEEKCKKEYMEEMKKLAAKHKDAISATKKKQWVSYTNMLTQSAISVTNKT